MLLNPEGQMAISRFSFNDALVMEGTVERFMSNLHEFMQTKPEEGEKLAAAVTSQIEQTYYGGAREPGGPSKPFVFQDGIAVIPVHGVLINRFNYSWGFVTGYNFVRSQFRAAMADADVKLIAFDVDSPGGDAPGCFELCEEIRAGRADKPSIAVVDALSASGGYAIASSATRMVCTPSGSVGSIGVYWIHADLSGMHERMGVKYTIFEAPEGGAKLDGAPYGPMSERAAKEAQARVNKRWDEFVALVVANRDMDEQSVRDTQARVYRADEALALTLIDGVSTPSEAVADFLGELASDDPIELEEDEMATEMPKDQAALDAITSKAATDAVAADRKRRQDIMALPEAASRQKLATSLADDDLSVEQAQRILKNAAEETVSAPQTEQQQQPQGQQQQQQAPQGQQTQQQQQQQQPSQFERAMDQGGGAGVGHQGGGEQQMQQQQPSEEDKALAILGDQAAVTGTDLRPKAN